jgi:hypothetical protein
LTRSLFWIGLFVAAFAAAWLILTQLPYPIAPLSDDIHYGAVNPWEVGNSEDAFDYAGEDAHTIEGTAHVWIDPSQSSGEIEIQVITLNTLAPILEPQSGGHVVLLRTHWEQADAIWMDRVTNGRSGIGDSRLPETVVQYGGSGQMDLWVDGEQRPGDWHCIWSIAPALRQLDGSIRDQGLVFSPLLRDRSGFADPERTELTLLIYSAPESDIVILHLVFPDVRIIEGDHTLD